MLLFSSSELKRKSSAAPLLSKDPLSLCVPKGRHSERRHLIPLFTFLESSKLGEYFFLILKYGTLHLKNVPMSFLHDRHSIG